MELGWRSVLKLAAFGVTVMIILQVTFFFILQNIGYDSYLLNISLISFILILIIVIIGWRIFTKKIS